MQHSSLLGHFKIFRTKCQRDKKKKVLPVSKIEPVEKTHNTGRHSYITLLIGHANWICPHNEIKRINKVILYSGSKQCQSGQCILFDLLCLNYTAKFRFLQFYMAFLSGESAFGEATLFSYVAIVSEAEGVIALELREGFFLGHKMQPNAHSLTSKSFCLNYI